MITTFSGQEAVPISHTFNTEAPKEYGIPGFLQTIRENKKLRTLCATGVVGTAIAGASLEAMVSNIEASATESQYAYDPANEVDVELVLAVDISQSMDTDEQKIQRDGYVAALTSREFLEAIQVGPLRRVAITYMEWGGVDEHFIVADWTVVKDAASAAHFASKIAEAPLRQVQRTSIVSALEKSVELVESNKYMGLRRVIDISGDGPNNQGGSVTEMRDRMVAAGVTINGLPLMMKTNKNSWQAMLNLDHYYEDCVIGGPGSFAIPVRSKEGFADAIRMKLVLEIAGLMPNDNGLGVRDWASLDAYDDSDTPFKIERVGSFDQLGKTGPNEGQAFGREPVRCNLFD